MQDIIEILREIICEYVEIEPEEITAESNVRFDLGASSFDLMNIAVAIEEKFKLKMSNAALPKIKTVGDIATLLADKI
jgi:acyl carrier protein